MPRDPIGRADAVLLAALTVYAALVLGRAAATWPLGIDESWHLYYADVEPLSKALHEWATDAHPPLSYALLRPIVALGSDPLWGRLASVVPALVQPWLLFVVLRRLGVARAVAHTGTAVFTVSQAFTVIGVVVRSYAMAAAWGLLALVAALDLLSGPASRRRAVVLLAAVALGTASLYAFALTAAAAGIAFAIAGACRSTVASRFVAELWRVTRRPERLAFVTSIGLVAAFYLVTWFHREFHHLDPWLLKDGEQPLGFAVDGASHLLATFTPIDPTGSVAAPWVVAGTTIAFGVAGVAAGGRRPEAIGVARATALWSVPTTALAFLLLAWLRVYPFGGDLRHQYPLFVLGVIAASVGLDELSRRLPSSASRAALCVVALGLGVTTTARSFAAGLPEVPAAAIWPDAASAVFDRDDPRPVCLPNVAFIAFYGRYMDRDWRLVESDRGFETFAGNRGPRLVRHRSTWSLAVVPDREFLVSLRRFCVDRNMTAIRVCATRLEHAGSVAARREHEPAVRARCAELGFRLTEWEVLPSGEAYVLERDG